MHVHVGGSEHFRDSGARRYDGEGVAVPWKRARPLHVILPHFVAIGLIASTQVGSEHNWGRWAPPFCDVGVAAPLETRVTTTCVTLPNLVILGQTVRT